MRDLEIYLRDIELPAMAEWLSCHLDQLTLGNDLPSGPPSRPVKATADYNGHRVRVSVYPGAGGKRYASLILEGNDLPWASDLECGRSAWRAMNTEVRCSPGDWKEGEPVQDEKWWRIDDRGEQLAVWN